MMAHTWLAGVLRTLGQARMVAIGGAHAHPRRAGVSVALLGPDGAGKSTLAARIQSTVGDPARCVYLGLGDSRAVDAGRFRPPELGPAGRLVRLWWRLLVAQRHRALGEIVIFDRHPVEARLPPRRRLNRLQRWSRWVRGHACPAPDLVLVLDAPGAMMYRRKGERTPEELEAERQDFRAWRERGACLHVLDATRAPDDVAAAAVALIARHRHARAGRD
jgi:thymidylate kinase